MAIHELPLPQIIMIGVTIMGEFSRTWWGKKFITAIESFTDSARLGRGRSYARGNKIVQFAVESGEISATIRGSVNAYFGVYKEPLYGTVVEIKPIPSKDWSQIISSIASNASFISKLLLNEVPENIESCFLAVNQHLLPQKQDFKTSCTCPDYSNPCKHIAGLCYRFATELDQDPFLLFELRGLTKQKLQHELRKTPLGHALVAGLVTEEIEPLISESYYTRPQLMEATTDTSLRDFWQGKIRPHTQAVETIESNISGILVKKQGDYPPFWQKELSFIETMDELYLMVKTKNKDVF